MAVDHDRFEMADAHAKSGASAQGTTQGDGMLRQSSSALVHGFGVSARDLSKLHVQGKHDECIALLGKLGGVAGIADKLSTRLRQGIPNDPDDMQHRREAYVEVLSGVSAVIVRWVSQCRSTSRLCAFGCVC